MTIKSLLLAALIKLLLLTVRLLLTYLILLNRSLTLRGRARYKLDNRKSKRAVTN